MNKGTPIQLYSFVKSPESPRFRFVREEALHGDFAMHTHDFFEIEIVVSGEAQTHLNGTPLSLCRGSAQVLSPTDMHDLHVLRPVTLYKLSVTSDWLSEDSLAELIGVVGAVQFTEQELADLIPLLDLLVKESGSELAERQRLREHLFGCVLCFFEKAQTVISSSPTAAVAATQQIGKSLGYILLNFTGPLSLKEVAEHSHLSSVYFSTVFHQTVGMPFVGYLNELRLNRARQLLRYSQLSVSEICYSCGFNSASHFQRLFKKRFGCSPTALRRTLTDKS